MNNETEFERKMKLWNEYTQTSEYKEKQAELESEKKSINRQLELEDKEWEILSSKKKGVLYHYGLFLRSYIDFMVCTTVSAYWTKQSNFCRREHNKSYETRTTKFRRDRFYWNHLIEYAEQKKMIDGSSWEERKLNEDELIVLKKYYDETRNKAMKDAIRHMDLHFPNED
jgi:hypothetical protein